MFHVEHSYTSSDRGSRKKGTLPNALSAKSKNTNATNPTNFHSDRKKTPKPPSSCWNTSLPTAESPAKPPPTGPTTNTPPPNDECSTWNILTLHPTEAPAKRAPCPTL